MNILFLSSWFPYPPDNGSRQRAFRLLKGFAREHRVTLIGLTDAEQKADPGALREYCERVTALPRRVFQPNRATALAALFSPQPRSIADTYDARVRDAITHALARETYDVLVAGELSMAVYAAPVKHPAKIFDDVEVGIFADAYEKASGRARWRAALTWFKFARYLRQLTENFRALTVVSRLEKKRAMALGIPGDHLHLVPNGVDCSDGPDTGTRRAPFTLVYNGALTYQANYDAMRYFVREILPLVRAQEPRVRLEITGRAPQFAINELSQDNLVTFTGYVDDVRAVVRSAAACVAPLRQGGGTRLKILEAMALGTPVISTAKGAEGLDLRDGEHLLLADTPDAFAQATLRVLQDSRLRERLSTAARKQVCAEYDWHVIQAQMEAVVQRVCARS